MLSCQMRCCWMAKLVPKFLWLASSHFLIYFTGVGLKIIWKRCQSKRQCYFIGNRKVSENEFQMGYDFIKIRDYTHLAALVLINIVQQVYPWNSFPGILGFVFYALEKHYKGEPSVYATPRILCQHTIASWCVTTTLVIPVLLDGSNLLILIFWKLLIKPSEYWTNWKNHLANIVTLLHTNPSSFNYLPNSSSQILATLSID